MTDRDKLCRRFADTFERKFIGQGEYEDRSIEQTLHLGWDLLSVFPEGELKRCDPKTIEAARKADRYKYMSQSATA